ncbi:hypothetical protein GGI43DRAFT_322630 [Trichoderma evansii]
MDHLPKIKEPAFGRLKIPYLCENEKYDCQEFSNYPCRSGWQLDYIEGKPRLDRADGSGSSVLEREVVLQAWLFFGLLSNILGISGLTLEIDDLIIERSGRKILSTHRLPLYLRRWHEAELKFSEETRQAHLQETLACLDEAAQFVRGDLCSLFHIRNEDEKFTYADYIFSPRVLRNDFALCITILGITLNNMVRVIWTDPDIHNHFETIPCHVLTAYQMESMNWCPAEIKMLNSGMMNVISAYLAGSLSRPLMWNGHKSCTELECKAYQVDEKTYRPKHVVEGCNCSFVAVDSEKVAAILSRGGTPTIIISDTDLKNGELKIDVVEAELYVAISHGLMG